MWFRQEGYIQNLKWETIRMNNKEKLWSLADLHLREEIEENQFRFCHVEYRCPVNKIDGTIFMRQIDQD